ncbi:MAG: hypothetical protein CMJ28_07560 [Phycisphaerae bacterium]|nr:hypothetical protein [Phycisphaerae bacterium]
MSLLIAMFIDTWRELTSRFLFWIVLAISAFIVLMLSSVGFDETGISLWWGISHSDHELLRRGTRNLEVVYRAFFSDVLVGFWLTYAATFLGLISTASVFPDFLSGGGVDMLLAKPRRRASIFIAKFLASLLFAAVPVTLVCLGVLISMRMALGIWEFEILYALPYVLLFYSSLFAVCVLVGTVTRSALASLLLTVVIWGLFLAASAVESTAGFAYDQIQQDIERVQNGDDSPRKRRRRGRPPPPVAEADLDEFDRDNLDSESEELIAESSPDSVFDRAARLESLEEFAANAAFTEKVASWVRWPLPKGIEIIDLMRERITPEDDPNFFIAFGMTMSGQPIELAETVGSLADQVTDNILNARKVRQSDAYVLGTTALFQLITLGLAIGWFSRRDY